MPKHKPVTPRTLGSRLRPKSRTPGKSILIVCEGKATEPNYFKALSSHLRLRPVEVEIVGKGDAPITVVNIALELKSEREQKARDSDIVGAFDKVWCVFDTENLDANTSYHTAVDKAQAHKFELALSNPCIELWFLLHFSCDTQPFSNCREAKAKMKSYLHGYHESMHAFEKIQPRTEDAIANARKLMEKHPNLTDEIAEKHPYIRVKSLNPSTTVHLLVEELASMSSKSSQKPG